MVTMTAKAMMESVNLKVTNRYREKRLMVPPHPEVTGVLPDLEKGDPFRYRRISVLWRP